ncbi:uncharacterized protein PG986_008354 [Apiospora aurea]|uniref:Uncharacterized protein n=1 Tax=Apiospora aurea TaxID=335848 RepID=A0ABR1QF69_9PEZI
MLCRMTGRWQVDLGFIDTNPTLPRLSISGFKVGDLPGTSAASTGLNSNAFVGDDYAMMRPITSRDAVRNEDKPTFGGAAEGSSSGRMSANVVFSTSTGSEEAGLTTPLSWTPESIS